MIVRRRQSDLLLIRQMDHARLSGRLAALIGNDRFAPPSPFGVVAGSEGAIGRHDDGWDEADQRPVINRHGLPAHVFEMPVEASLPIWSESTRLAAERDPYAGLLVSLHGLHLSLVATTASPVQVFQVNRFQHEQVEIQERLRGLLGMRTDRPLQFGLAVNGGLAEEDLLAFNFRLLQLLDAVSLDLCFDEARVPTLANIIPRIGAAATTMEVRRKGADEFTVDPWPFGEKEVDVDVPGVSVEMRRYADERDLRAAVEKGEREIIRVRLLK